MNARPTWVLGPGAVAAGRKITGPVTVTTVHGSFDRIGDAVFNPEPLRAALDLTRFTGRDWIISQIDRYIATHQKGYVVVQGEAGVGKSALAAHLAFTRPCVHHFTRLEGARSPEQARRSLAAQLIGQWRLFDLVPSDSFPAGAGRPDWLLKVIAAAAAARDAAGRTDPLVLVVDGLDEADQPAAGQDTGIPLGLPRPEHLPTGVFLVVTTRFGISLPAVRGPAAWTTITVDGADNLADVRTYLSSVTAGPNADNVLVERLARHGIDREWFVDRMADQSHGVWMYLRYVLDDIREQRRAPTALDGLPEDLSGYYFEQIQRWRTVRDSWLSVGLPLFATLAALRRPVGRVELAQLAGTDKAAVDTWLDGELRPFLEVTQDSACHRLYNVRHQSLRDLFEPPVELDHRDAGARESLREALRDAHERIAVALIPSGPVESRNWSVADAYTRMQLPEHAAKGGQLDELSSDPGFLLICDPLALLRWSSSVTTEQARSALAAYQFTVDSWSFLGDDEQRLWWLHVWARKTRATLLAERAVAPDQPTWTVAKAMWSGTSHRSLTDHTGGVLAMCLVPLPGDRVLLATAGRGKSVQLWNPSTGEAVGAPLTGHTEWIFTVCVLPMPDGRILLASGGSDQSVRLWDPVSGEPVGEPLAGHDDTVHVACAVPLVGGRVLLATAGVDRTVRLWDPSTGKAVGRPMTGHREQVNAACAVPVAGERTLLATAGNDATVRLWDPVSGEPVGEPLAGHAGRIDAMCVVPWPDGRTLLATAGEDATVWLWDPATGAAVDCQTIGRMGLVTGMCVLPVPDGRTLLAVVELDETRLWDPVGGEEVGPPLTGHADWLRTACTVPTSDGRTLLATAADDNTVRIWDPVAGRTVGDSRTGPQSLVFDMCVVPIPGGRTLLATSGLENVVRLWDPTTGQPVGEPINTHDRAVMAMCAVRLTDQRTLLVTSGSAGDTVHMWDPATGTATGEPIICGGDGLTVLCPVPLADGRTLVAGAAEFEKVRLWDPNTSKRVHRAIAFRIDSIRKMCAVPLAGGRTLLAAGAGDGKVELRDARSGRAVGGVLTGHTNAVLSMCCLRLPDGRTLLATAGYDETIRLWDPLSGQEVGKPLVWHTFAVNTMCALPTPDGRVLLAAAGDDRTVRIWDPLSGEPVGEPLAGHDGSVKALCAVPQSDGRMVLASTGDDRAVLIWRATLPS